jgi:two-component system chemotaxis response regulator CheB
LKKLNILIVEKSPLYKNMLASAVEGTGLGQVTRYARDGATALEKLKNAGIDAVLIDAKGPGVTPQLLARLSLDLPEGNLIIMLGEGEKDRPVNLGGPFDYIVKPAPENGEKGEESLRKQLQGLFTLIITGKYTRGAAPRGSGAPADRVDPPGKPALKKRPENIDLVVIAASTGGPSALEAVLKKLPAHLDRPVLVVQHMPGELTGRMSRSLDKKCPLAVIEAGEGSKVSPGTVLVAPGGYHMALGHGRAGRLEVRLESSAPVNGVKPSADVLLNSIARHCHGKGVLAVILTGMGSDGMRGVGEVKSRCQCYCITQSERTCVVYGMPKSVVDAGLSDEVKDLEEIPAAIMNIVSGRGF